jgi:hypothetical protein
LANDRQTVSRLTARDRLLSDSPPFFSISCSTGRASPKRLSRPLLKPFGVTFRELMTVVRFLERTLMSRGFGDRNILRLAALFGQSVSSRGTGELEARLQLA